MICKHLKECVEGEFAKHPIVKCDNNNQTECRCSSDNRSFVSCEEKGKKYTLENTMKKQVISYRMDEGIIALDKDVPEGTAKCDYLYVLNDPERTAILTELKGVDVPRALRQLDATLTLFKTFFRTCAHVHGRIIVASSTPDLKAKPEYVNLVKRLGRDYAGTLKIAKRELREKDIELIK